MTRWRDDSPPKDGRLLLLIVCYEDDGPQDCDAGLLEDAVRYSRTIGFNDYDNVRDPEAPDNPSVAECWHFAGWDWCADEFVRGPTRVRVVKWADFPAAPPGFSHLDL